MEVEMEGDDRRIAEIVEIPGVMTYGATQDEAVKKTESLALRVIAERIENSEAPAASFSIRLPAAA